MTVVDVLRHALWDEEYALVCSDGVYRFLRVCDALELSGHGDLGEQGNYDASAGYDDYDDYDDSAHSGDSDYD